MDDKTLIQLTYITIAPNREKVLKAFANEDFIRPRDIVKRTGIHPNNVSKHLKGLREHGMVYVINPDYHVPRLYRLTPKGKRLLNLLY